MYISGEIIKIWSGKYINKFLSLKMLNDSHHVMLILQTTVNPGH